MDPKFTAALPHILRYEGGYVNDPNDHGGATNKGVTQKVYDNFRKTNKLLVQSVKSITQAEVEAIYFAGYWKAAHCHELPPPVDLAVFDTAVNMGVSRAVKFLQEALNIPADGAFGPQSLAAVQAHPNPQALAVEVVAKRRAFYWRLAQDNTQKKFLKGWLNRVHDLEQNFA
jgi:lysozyme family protein